MARGSAEPLDLSEARTLLSIVDDTAGRPDVEDFRLALTDALRRALDAYGVLLVHRADGQVRAQYAKPDSDVALEAAYPECHAEHAAWLEGGELPPIGIATRDLPDRVLRSFATFQVVWPEDAVAESICARLGDPGPGVGSGLLISSFQKCGSPHLNAAARVLTALRPYVHGTLLHYRHLERVRARLAAMEAIAGTIPAIVVGPAGRLEAITPAAELVFLERTGSPEPPPALVSRIAAGGGDPLGPFAFDWLDVRVYVHRAAGGPSRMATLEPLSGPAPTRIAEAARALGFGPRETELLGLVCRGLLNKEIADRLGLREQTVKNRLRGVFERTGARNRADLVRILLGAPV